jgi:protein gp37
MSENSKISWTDATWNPLRGCTRVSEGCRNCYAERIAARFSERPKDYEGAFQTQASFEGIAIMTPSGPRWTGKVKLVESVLDAPLHWRKPRKVFVNSMSDLFHESVPDEWIDRVFAVMALCPQHTFQVLTKRPERMNQWCSKQRWVAEGFSEESEERYLENVWLGVSVENQATADARIPHLLRTPAALRFVSYEPALGPVDLYKYLPTLEIERESGMWRDLIRWVIVGGESGPGARPCDIAWIRTIRDQCKAATTPYFVKQLGAKPYNGTSKHMGLHSSSGDGRLYHLKDRKGGDMSEWPEDLRVQEFPR